MTRQPKKRKPNDQWAGPNEIPRESMKQVLLLLREGNRSEASELLSTLAINHQLLSYEVHHLSQHLQKQAALPEFTVHTHACEWCGTAVECYNGPACDIGDREVHCSRECFNHDPARERVHV